MEKCFCGKTIKNDRCAPCNATFLSPHQMLINERGFEKKRKEADKIEKKRSVGKVEVESLRKVLPSTFGSTLNRYFSRKKK